MTETYTSGIWTVKPGEEDAFVAEGRTSFGGRASSRAPARFGSSATSTGRIAS